MESQSLRSSPSPSVTESTAGSIYRRPGVVYLILLPEEALAIQALLTSTAGALDERDGIIQNKGIYSTVLQKVEEEIKYYRSSQSPVSDSVFANLNCMQFNV